MKMGSKLYNYYRVDIPSDVTDSKMSRFSIAVEEARERARLYKMPCTWRLVKDDGRYVTVCRESNRGGK